MLPAVEERIEQAAERLRLRLSIDEQTAPDMITVLYKLKEQGIIADYARVPDWQMRDDEAEYDPTTQIIRLRESTFCAANDMHVGTEKRRARFTIAHECGHAWLGHKRLRHRNISGRAIEKFHMPIVVDESHANRFGGAFLVPRRMVDVTQNPTVEEIAEKFVISRSAAEVRLEQTRKLHRHKHRIKRPLPDEIRQFLLDAKRRGHNITSLDDD